MIALFLGDYFQLATLRRWILIVFALALAFIFNAARAFILILVMELRGVTGMMKFHDPAGFSISLASLLVLWAAASFMGSPEVAASGKSRSRTEILRFPSGWLITLLLAWLGAEMLNQGWYLWCERNSVPGPVWSLRWPPHPNFKEEAIDDVARTYLRYDYGVHGTWNDQYQWEIFFFTWNPSRAAAGLAESHHPDICLPAVGYILKKELPIEIVDINGTRLPVTRYIFQDPFDGSLLYAFEAVTDDRIRPDLPDEHIDGASRLRRLHMAWIGKRNPGQRSLLIVNRGADNLEEAENGVRSLLTEALITSQ
jgi:hypothetical protein